jgi:ribosomal protein S18 acetylase RimI-like enzyme
MTRIIQARSAAAIAKTAMLFRQYAQSLGIDLSFQDFEDEVAALPGDYSPPGGCLLVAFSIGSPAGCVGVRPVEPGICEMKRLYVSPEARGLGLGRALAEAAIRFGRDAGYRTMRLDTLPQMAAARALYRHLGFREIPPYRYNPILGTTFMELALVGGPQE